MHTKITDRVAFQGGRGANSERALLKMLPNAKSVPRPTFEEVFDALEKHEAEYALIPVENSVAGRIADIHHLLPKANVSIIGEHFERVEHMFMSVSGAKIEDIVEVHSQVPALGQCRTFITEHNLKEVVHSDTAGAAQDVSKWGDPTKAAIATKLAAELYDLEILAENIEDADHNTTRFLLISNEANPEIPSIDEPVITSIFFSLRSVPAALYKAIGGFSTNGINMTRLESYIGERFQSAQFFVDVEGHPESTPMKHALDELDHFTEEYKILGTYRAHPYRNG